MAIWALASLPNAHGHEPESPREFLQSVYGRYLGSGKEPETLGDDAPAIFAQDLLSLIREDQRVARGEVGLLDHDPVCSCQDSLGLKITSICVTELKGDHAKGTVRFVIGQTSMQVQLALVRRAGLWRIEDIREPGIESLVRYLETGLAKLRR